MKNIVVLGGVGVITCALALSACESMTIDAGSVEIDFGQPITAQVYTNKMTGEVVHCYQKSKNKLINYDYGGEVKVEQEKVKHCHLH